MFISVSVFIKNTFGKIYFKFRKIDEKTKEDPHYIDFTKTPIPSFKLSQALNPKTEENKLVIFSKDEDPYVRRAVARNPSLPKENLEELSKDKVLIVAKEAKGILDSPDIKVEETYPTQHGG